MADDDKLEPGDDPWADLDSEPPAELGDGFSFSFEEQPGEGQPLEQAEAVGLPEDAVESESLALPDGLAELLAGPGQAPAGLTAGDGVGPREAHDEADEFGESIGAWLDEPAARLSGPELSVFQEDEQPLDGIDSFERAGDPGGDESSIQIGTGTSGIASPSSIDSFGSEVAGEGADPFAEFTPEPEVAAAADSWAGPPGDDPEVGAAPDFESFESFESSAADPADPAVGDEPNVLFSSGEDSLPVAADGQPASEDGPAAAPVRQKTPLRRSPPRKKQPSMVGQLIGVVGGGAMSIPIVLGILWWGVGRDPLQVAPLVPDSLGFLVPAKFRSSGQVGAVAGRRLQGPGLDDLLGAGTVDDVGLAAGGRREFGDESTAGDEFPQPEIPALDPVDPPETGLAASVQMPAVMDDVDDDPLAALLREEEMVAAAEPAPVEPEPLDLSGLEAAAEKATAALAAVGTDADIRDPVTKKLLVNCYRALAAYAQELVLLERVALDSGRPLADLPSPAEDVHRAVVNRPDLHDTLTRLTRDWLASDRHPSDGVFAFATFDSARKAGPYWRTEVTVGDRPLVLISRSEPAAVPGEAVIVTGLAIEGGVLWATDVRPARAGNGFGFGP